MPVLVLVMTDVEASTRQWAEHQAAMFEGMRRHHEIVHAAIEEHGGWRPTDQGEGDAVFAAFESAGSALGAVLDFQRALAAERWPTGIDLRVRVGVHIGDVALRDGNLFGPVVNRCARIRGLGAGGQVLVSAAVFEIVRDRLPSGVELADLGEHRMKDLTRPERIYEVRAAGLRRGFPALAGLDRAANNLPQQPTSFIGREHDLQQLVDLVMHERLVTITGFGGIGKTRLALQAAAELAEGDGDGVWFVDLAAIEDASRVPGAVAEVLGLDAAIDDAGPQLLEYLRDRRLLLVLDNLEQLLPEAAPVVARIAAAGAGVRVLVTSREPVQVRGERVLALDPLPLPSVSEFGESDLGALGTYASVALLLDRAAAARRDFALTPSNAAAIAAICGRLDGLPLALELAASRLRMLSPEALLQRLDNALGVLTGGGRDLPSRQQTIRATIAWSVDALDESMRSALSRLSVFAASFSADAAEAVIGADVDAFDVLSVLVDRSLLRVQPQPDGEDRYRLLVTIREFAAERLVGVERAAAERRHAAWFASLLALPSGWSPEQYDARNRAVPAVWPDVRLALDRLHRLGEPDAEQALTADAATGVLRYGRIDEGALVVEHALQHAAAGRDPLVLERLLADQALVAMRRGQRRVSLDFAMQAVAAARGLGDPAVLVIAICRSIAVQHDAAAAAGLLAEAAALAEGVSGALAYPSWYVQDRLRTAVINSAVVDRPLAEALWRPILTSATGNELARARYYLAALLADRRDDRGALDLLTPYRAPDPPESEPFGLTLMRISACGLLLRLGRPDEARSLIDRIDAGLPADGLTMLQPDVEWLHAAVDRADARLDAAATRLEALTEHGGAVRADAAWLLAVVRRQLGQFDASVDALRTAVRLADEQATDHNLLLACAREASWASAPRDPRSAVELLACSVRHRGDIGVFPDVDHFVVEYDVGQLDSELRRRVGETEWSEAHRRGTDSSLAEALASWMTSATVSGG